MGRAHTPQLASPVEAAGHKWATCRSWPSGTQRSAPAPSGQGLPPRAAPRRGLDVPGSACERCPVYAGAGHAVTASLLSTLREPPPAPASRRARNDDTLWPCAHPPPAAGISATSVRPGVIVPPSTSASVRTPRSCPRHSPWPVSRVRRSRGAGCALSIPCLR